MYERINWENGEAGGTPLDAVNLNKGDLALSELMTGWISLPGTLTYASATTMNTSENLTGVIGIGDKIKLTQTTAKYFYVVAITSSLITVTAGSDYTVANATITSPEYSHVESPLGFPGYFNWTPTYTGGLTIGNGSGFGTFTMTGSVIHIRTGFVFGSTTAITGAFGINYPIVSSFGNYAVHGELIMIDVGTNTFKGTIASGVDAYALLFANNVAGTYEVLAALSSTIPFTWTTNDTIRVNATYRI